MHVLFVTSEVAGVYKIGGLADVSYSLPIALQKIGVSVTVVLPFYNTISADGAKGFGECMVDFADSRETVFVFEKKLPGVPFRLLLLRHPMLEVYGGKPIERTFAFYSKAVASLYDASERLFNEPVDVIHCHDWHTAVVPLLIGENNKLRGPSGSDIPKKIHTVVTIHNLMYQGVVSDGIIDDLHAPRDLFHLIDSSGGQSVSFLREGFEYADRVTTVSPTYAREIVAESHQDAIGRSLARRKHQMLGILNGIDTDSWNPQADKKIPYRYTGVSAAAVKPKLKKTVQKAFGLPTENVFLLGFVGRIEPRQKGIDLVMGALPKCLNDMNIQMVILGTGEEKTMEQLSELARKFPKNISYISAFDDKIARLIYSGCDSLVVPSRFEPCGLTQMIAMRYGTIPIVRKTGGLADTVADGRSGFVFEQYNPDALGEAVTRASSRFAEDPDRWSEMVRAVMKEDLSWNKSALEYEALYRSLLKK